MRGKMASSKRDILVDTALQLFSENGYRATGIDKILEESGVAKMTLYKHFKSKDELIIATLQRRDENFSKYVATELQRRIPLLKCDPRIAKLMAYLDFIHEWISSDSFTGCNFINASVEFKRADDPIHIAASNYQMQLIKMIEGFLEQLHLENAFYVARAIHMLIEGAIVIAGTFYDKTSGQQAKENIIKILNSYEINPPLEIIN